MQKNKRTIIIAITVLSVFFCWLFCFFALSRPTKMNAFIASTLYEEPANKDFSDDNFYQCVVDMYNHTNGTKLPYTTALTDEQLQTITTLSCNGGEKDQTGKIIKVDGLEKLTLLEYLNLSENLILNITFDNNTLLKDVNLSNNNLTRLDLSPLTNLTSLIVYKNSLATLNVMGNSQLSLLSVSDNSISTINLTNNINLVNLYLENNQLKDLDLSKNINLEQLNLSGNLLKKIDITDNLLIEKLSIYGNELTEINLEKNASLSELQVHFNSLSTLNLENNSLLKIVCVSNNQLKTINISQNLLLEDLNVSSNKLPIIDLSKNESLHTLNLSNNNLSELDLSNNTALSYLRVNNNPFKNNITIYKDTPIEVNKDLIKFPLGKTSKITSLSSNTLEVNTKDNQIQSHTVGAFDLNVSYRHDMDLYYNTYSGSYTVNVIELTSEKYLINNEKGYIYIGDDTDLNEIRNNISVPENVLIDINLESNKLTVIAEGAIIKEFDLVRISSNHYDLSKEYIYVGHNSFDLENLSVINCDKEVKDGKLLIKYDDDILDQYIIISYNSEFYDLTDKYIFIGTSPFDIQKVEVINGKKEFTNGKFFIKYGEEILQECIIIGYNSTKYDLTKEYIYVGRHDFDIDAIEVVSMEKEIKDNNLLIKFENEVLKQYPIVGFASKKYDLSKDYIYIATNSFDIDAIEGINMEKEIKDNKLLLKYNEEVLQQYSIVGYNSRVYDLTKEYIYTGAYSFDINNINVINMSVEEKDNKLLLSYQDISVEYLIINFSIKDFKVKDKNIFLYYESTVTYDEFASSITTNGVAYKIYDNDREVTDGNLSEGMTLKIYLNGNLLDEYLLLDEYYKFSELLNVDETQKLIYKLKEGTTLANLSSMIDTSGEVRIQDVSSKYIESDDRVGTKYKIIIEFSKTKVEYTLSVSGDVTYDGIVNIADVLKIADHTISENILDEIEILSAEVTNDTKLNIADVVKIADYTIDNSIQIWK